MPKSTVAFPVDDPFLGDNLEAIFEKSTKHLRVVGAQLDPSKLLYFYARYKQAKEGPCNQPKPGFFDFQGKEKWSAWSSLGDMSKKEAMAEYVQGVEELDPDWLVRFDETAAGMKAASTPFGGVSVSSMAKTEADLEDGEKTLFDWVKEGEESRVKSWLTKEEEEGKEAAKTSLHSVDENGMTVLHWCCDRGHASIAEILLDRGCSINCLDACGQAPLHYAVSCGHVDVVRLLLEKGADVSIKDEDDCAPLDLADDDQMRQMLQAASA